MKRLILGCALLAGGLWACDDGGATATTMDADVRDMADDAMVIIGQSDARPVDGAIADAAPAIDQAVPDATVGDTGVVDAGGSDARASDDGVGPALDQGAAVDQGPPVMAAAVYDTGPFAVAQTRLAEGMSGAPRALDVYAPVDAPAAPVIVWQHGFLLDVALYSDMLTHLASHGFVVVAPQMYPADNLPFGKPTSAEEAATAATILDWVSADLADVVDGPLDQRAPGIAGHSRGGKVTWLLMIEDASRARAIAGVDPVDGQGGPLGGEARALDSAIDFGGVLEAPADAPLPATAENR